MTNQATITLNDGSAMPQFGLGVWQTPQDEAAVVVRTAIEAGYRSIDTAAIYGNERGVGEGVRASGAPREELFITTKLWNNSQGYDEALKACDNSLGRLGLDYVDLYLIHWPAPGQGKFVDAWRALVRLREDGRARSIGVSNFQPHHLERVIAETGVVPAVNQVELHPRFQQRPLRVVHAKRNIATESWSPLGRGMLLDDPVITKLARKHGKTPAQVVIRWHIDNGLIVIPKSVNAERIRANAAVFDFRLEETDLEAMGQLDIPTGRIGPDPDLTDF